MDVAELGLAVRSDQVEKGTLALDKLSTAAVKAEAASDRLAASSGKVNAATGSAAGGASKAAASISSSGGAATAAARSMGLYADSAGRLRNALGQFATAQDVAQAEALAMAGALDEQSAAALRAASAMGRLGGVANDNRPVFGANAMNVGNLAAQFQDIAVTSAMAMSPLQIALQQGTQISAVLGPMGAAGAVSALGAAFASVLSPVSLFTIALVGLAAAGIQMVDWPAAAAGALNMLADSLVVIAPYAAGAAAGLALLYAPAIIGGMVSLVAWLARISVAAVTAAATMAAANPGLALIIGLTAAVAAANVFRDELATIFGRDIVEDAKNGVNFIIGAFVGGFEGIKAAWSQLPAALGDVTASTANAVISGIEGMINKAVAGINSLIEKANSAMSMLPEAVRPGAIGTLGSVSLGRVQNSNAGAASDVMSSIGASMSAAQGTDYVGGITGAITRGASAAADKLRELASGLTEVEEKSKRKGGGKSEAEKMADNYADIVRGAEQFIEKQELERQSIGMTEQAAAALRYEQELLNKAANDNIKLTPAQTAQLKALATDMAAAEAETSALRRAFDFAKETTQGFFSDLTNGLRNGEGVWESFKNAALNAIGKIADAMVSSGVNSLFSGASAGGGGFFGNLLGGIGSLFGFAKGAAFQAGNVVPFAGGGVVSSATAFPMANGRTGLMGEAGPEAIMPLKRGRDGKLGVAAGGAAGGQTAANQNLRIEQHFHISGAVSSRDVEQMVRRGSEQAVAVVKDALPSWNTDIQVYGKPA